MPQMMPLPWLMVFLMIFFCFFSVSLLVGFFFLDNDSISVKMKKVEKFYMNMPW